MFPTYEIFSQVMDQCTSNYECLVIDNTTKSNKIEDMVFWYKADNHPAFKLGAPEFWQHHSRNYDNSVDEEDTDINQYGKKKNAPQINVKKILIIIYSESLLITYLLLTNGKSFELKLNNTLR